MKAAILTILAVLALSVPVMAQDEIISDPSFFGMLSEEDTEEAFKRMRSIPWENVASTHSFDENPLVRAVVEDDKYTYFAFVPDHLPVVYLSEDGIDRPVDSNYLEEIHAIAVKNKADTWVVRHGDKYVVAIKKAAQ